MSNDETIFAALKGVSTATITTILLKRGIQRIYMHGPLPIQRGQGRVVGRAFTMRFIPAREDLANPANWSSPRSTRAAIEQMPAGCVVVADAMGRTDAGVVGDILCARMKQRGVAGLVTDGAVRDMAGIVASGLPVWSRAAAAPPAIAGLHFANWQDDIACGQVAVRRDEIIVADDDGAVVIPEEALPLVLEQGPEQERMEEWIFGQVQHGAGLLGLYPPNEDNVRRYNEFKNKC
jgi:regulator of RNase E activity RraA